VLHPTRPRPSARRPEVGRPSFRPLFRSAGLALALGLLSTDPAAATDRAVPGEYPSIGSALAVSVAGDHILVAPGVYGEGFLAFRGRDVTVESTDGPASTVLDFGGGRIGEIGPRGALVGFTVTNADFRAGVGLTVYGDGTRIEGNVFDGTLPANTGSALLRGMFSSPIIEANVFRGYRCLDDTVSGLLTFSRSSAPVVRNNVFGENDCAAFFMLTSFGTAARVQNNTFVGNRIAIRLNRGFSAGAQAYRNNLITGNQTGVLLEQGTANDDPVWESNLVFGNGMEYNEDPDPAGTGGNLSVDPRLVDVAGGDYRLAADSPALDTGSDVEAPSWDVVGTPRPLDGDGDGMAVVDIGAFERLEPVVEVSTPVQIDIRPFSNRNFIPVGRKRALVLVLLLGSEDFDVSTVDASSLAFGPDGARAFVTLRPRRLDLNHDGYRDMLMLFRIGESGLSRGDGEACLSGEAAGVAFEGCDRVTTGGGGPPPS